MHEPKMCPVCGSKNIELKSKSGFLYVCCKDCEYDEGEDYDVSHPGERSAQKSKGSYTPYKRGGSQRSRK